jgi:RNA polymerase sigma factor (sigma-70 family)
MSPTFACCKVNAISAEQMARHEGLVRWVVRRQRLKGLPFDDALHEGRIGLWAALRRFDPECGTAFSSYAVPAIAHAVWRAVAVYRSTPTVPGSTTPVDASPDTYSASQSIVPPSGIPRTPSVYDGRASDLAQVVHQSQVRSTLLSLVEYLPPRLRQVIVAHYGLADTPAQSFAAIGRTMGISRQRVHQLHVTAILWLAHPANSLPLRRLLERNRRSDYRQAIARQSKAACRARRNAPRRARR